jgi:hypothetical protein
VRLKSRAITFTVKPSRKDIAALVLKLDAPASGRDKVRDLIVMQKEMRPAAEERATVRSIALAGAHQHIVSILWNIGTPMQGVLNFGTSWRVGTDPTLLALEDRGVDGPKQMEELWASSMASGVRCSLCRGGKTIAAKLGDWLGRELVLVSAMVEGCHCCPRKNQKKCAHP